MIKYLFIYFLLFTISVTAGESGDQKNTLNKQENNLTKEEKIIEDPFFRDLTKELSYRQNLSSISFYSLDSLKLVATLQLPVNDQNLQELRKKIYRTWGSTDKSNPGEFFTHDNYKQVSYQIMFEGTFIDYINFIKDIQFEDKSLSTNDVIITKIDGDKIDITSTLTVNIMKI